MLWTNSGKNGEGKKQKGGALGRTSDGVVREGFSEEVTFRLNEEWTGDRGRESDGWVCEDFT